MIFFNRKSKAVKPVRPLLHTERLVLRSFDPNDAVDLYAFARSETVGYMAGFTPHQSLEDSRRMVKQFIDSGAVWAIVEKRSGRVIGFASLQKDDSRPVPNARKLAYTLGEEYWGQGYATETCRELIRYAFEVRDCAVLAVSHFPFNQKSKRVIKKLGFTYEGVLRHAHALPDGSVSDLVCYSLLKPEYEARKAGKNGG
ncbi:MAG: GNAT family N-acetyltransferase [Clostridia bacterium]|nr:GNAT family N-acetyltransferase [Clostridia bacterium]